MTPPQRIPGRNVAAFIPGTGTRASECYPLIGKRFVVVGISSESQYMPVGIFDLHFVGPRKIGRRELNPDVAGLQRLV